MPSMSSIGFVFLVFVIVVVIIMGQDKTILLNQTKKPIQNKFISDSGLNLFEFVPFFQSSCNLADGGDWPRVDVGGF